MKAHIIYQQYDHNENLRFSIIQLGKAKAKYSWTAFNTLKNQVDARQLWLDYVEETGVKFRLEVEPA